MRLLSFRDDVFQLHEFYGNLPPYAILSHTWGADDDEVTFADIMDKAAPNKHKLGFKKLLFCATKAAALRIEYFWIDTCCIDKSSSTELTEAINSMFRWYRDAAYCFVYLEDVFTADCGPMNMSRGYRLGEGTIASAFPELGEDVFRRSRWFTRGWTLQELLASKSGREVRFYTSGAQYLGNRRQLSSLIAAVTGIPVEALAGRSLKDYSISDRLRWAENRSTKREEDAAYSLLGIFDVHMPLLYGEGRENAMFRLLQESQEQERRRLASSRTKFGAYFRLNDNPFWLMLALLYPSLFCAIFFSTLAQGNDPIVAPFVKSTIARTRLAGGLRIIGLRALELGINLVAVLRSSLTVAFVESGAIMLLCLGACVILVCVYYSLHKIAQSLPHSSIHDQKLKTRHPDAFQRHVPTIPPIAPPPSPETAQSSGRILGGIDGDFLLEGEQEVYHKSE